MRILYQLTSPMDKTVGPEEVARRQRRAAEPTPPPARRSRSSRPRAARPPSRARTTPALVVPELIRLAPRAEKRGFSAMIIGCYSDPGLDALREMLTIPVIGPGAASLHLAAQLGTRISRADAGGARLWPRGGADAGARAWRRCSPRVRGIGLSVMDLAKQARARSTRPRRRPAPPWSRTGPTCWCSAA